MKIVKKIANKILDLFSCNENCKENNNLFYKKKVLDLYLLYIC